ncbi:zinc finger protein 638-like [Parambassis ranga]|uniref:Zinc finger protein 638-like n=1 Tax=Parambassis ranga TaxID=210632 RepID=A0A6P7IVQ8_9TELE|nr:zinc finger protein 638-like [Parambassis ranga]
MQKTKRRKQAQRATASLTKAAHRHAVQRDSNSQLAPSLCLEPGATLSIANNTRGNHFVFGPVAGVAAVTALRLAQIETQAQIALQQLATLATITVGNHCYSRRFSAALPPLALLSLSNRQQVSSVQANTKTFRTTQLCLSPAMYHQHSQQQGTQSFPNGPRPPHHQTPSNQHQNHSNMPVMGFQFPRPTQLPDELESALAIRGARDMDHRQIDHMNRSNPHQNQGSGSSISQHGGYGSNQVPLSTDTQTAHQQGVDWSSYQPPPKLFASPPPNSSHQPQQHQGPQSSQTSSRVPSWGPSASDSSSAQTRHPHGGSGEGQNLYTPESAGSILASFGLSNEDLELLSHYPDDQLTPDTLPFILRDIQINKSGNQKNVASTSASPFSRSVQDRQLPPSRSSPEVPSLLTVTQTAGKVIDYGHASRAKDQSSTKDTFNRDSSSSAPKVDKLERPERRQVRLEPAEPSKHGDRDYRGTHSDHRKSSVSPGREFPPSHKSRNLDRDYRRDGSQQRPSSETRSEASSRRSLSSSSGSKPHSSNKKFPTPTMASDFSAVPPKVYPHTCSLCNIECDQEKDWIDHINTVKHTAACRELRNKYPDWKPNAPSRSGQYGSQTSRGHSPSHSLSRSRSRSPPPHGKHRMDPHPYRPQKRPYSPNRHPPHPHYTEPRHRFEHHHPGSHSFSYKHRTSSSSREHWPERGGRQSSGGCTRSGVKRPHENVTKTSVNTKKNPPASTAGHATKRGLPAPSAKNVKSGAKPGTKTTKTVPIVKPPPAKKKKKAATPASQNSSAANRLVYLTGIPKDASEQEVTDLAGSFGKINNVILMPCSEEESEKDQGQKASICMMKAEDARALAISTNLFIREQQITASVVKKPDPSQSSDANKSKPAPGKGASVADSAALSAAGGDTAQKTSDEKGTVLLTGLPETGWTENDIISVVQPFGTHSDLVLAAQIGKVLVSFPNMEVAQEMVKVHSVTPAMIADCQIKVALLKQHISLSTPVALYNLLMCTEDPLASQTPVSWNTLLVIRNVPDTPSGPSEVQKLVRRFGTVIKTLVVNTMIICEMATAAMAMSVHKRFQIFPCIIHNNPLYFSRKPDPKVSPQPKTNAACQDSSEKTPANAKGSQTVAAADTKEAAQEESSDSPMNGVKKDGDKEEEMKTVVDDIPVSDSSAALDAKVEDVLTDAKEASETVMETAEKNVCENDKTSTSEEAKPAGEKSVPELPKVTQVMVNALLVECRTKTASQPSSTATTPTVEQDQAPMQKKQGEKAADASKEPAKNQTDEEAKKQERDRKEREVREARERKERERKVWEKEERYRKEKMEKARRERERREEERRQWERKERERRQSKRGYSDSLKSKSEGYKQRDGRHNTETKAAEPEEEPDEFPFNLSDFVTLDEVGDVTDLPDSPPPTVPMESSEGVEDAPTSIQQDAPGVNSNAAPHSAQEKDTPMEATATPDTSETTEHENAPIAEQPEVKVAPETDPALKVPPDSKPEDEPLSMSHSDESSTAAAESGATVVCEGSVKEDAHLNHSQAEEEEVLSIKEEEKEVVQDERKTEMAADTGTQESLEDSINSNDTKSNMETTKTDLPPFDPKKPVGMEFLVPKTGFFCKPCSRFFSGAKEAEINHCKTLKHYENLQKYLQNTKTVSAKPDSS